MNPESNPNQRASEPVLSPNATPDAAATGSEPSEVKAPTPIKMDRFECRVCGYLYEPLKGDSKGDIAAGTAFKELPKTWRCPVCGAPTSQFTNVGPSGKVSGFQENLGYGFGVNALTPGQKSILIFGSLALAVIFFLSLYGLR